MQHKYFAASNSADGFKSYFYEIFGRADRVYIIKGGPGTGKSSFMRRCAKKAEKNGETVEYYYCSSDPESLDGVLIYSQKGAIGILDGTAPHVCEPELAGAREELINLGSFWDGELLRKQKNEIASLTRKKSAAFKRAYKYLRSCGNLRAVTDSLIEDCIDFEKLKAAAARLAKTLSEKQKGERFSYLPAIRNGISMSGLASFDSFEQSADKLYLVGDAYGVGNIFLDCLWEELSKTRVSARVSYDPVCPRHIDGIFVEDDFTAVLLSRGVDINTADAEKLVNPKRFILPEKVRAVRGEMRYALKLYEGCLEGALHALSDAKVYHFLLEDIYKNAMDFTALTKYTDEFLNKAGF